MRKRTAFTIIELLVVIAIIGILASLMVPAIMKAAGSNASEVPALKGPVNDYANILPAADQERLRSMLLAQEEKTSNQIVILTIKSLNGDTIEAYADKVFNTWKLGQKGKDNGILIVHSTGDRKMRIEVGKGLQGPIPDSVASRIIRDQMTPRFKANDFAGGHIVAVTALISAAKGEFKAADGGGNINFPQENAHPVAPGWPWWVWLLIIVGVIVVVLIFLAFLDGFSGGGISIGSSGFSSGSGGGNWGGGGGDSGGGGYSGGGGGGDGGGASGSY
ncbi:MAG: TPM domain-containing protein [Candidatus Peribacteraceae bacterium]|nr:TPM domain-containing protein [Candidatus Peribacteraceae bacterium]MDD5075036.1 TPM domain-containing protein [Candidatus Peribacteraceae bacterium]